MITGMTPNKSLGQHWLRDTTALTAMVEAGDIQSKDTVLEIGPGLGTLTALLTAKAKRVIAVEFDGRLADALPHTVAADNLVVVAQDILKFNFAALPAGYKVVANIPYYLTSNLIRVLSETVNPPTVAVLLVQQEVAERVAAAPGAMSLLSVTAQYYWHVTLGQIVPAELFSPPPKVNSRILRLDRYAKPRFPEVTPKQFFRLVRGGFSQRRKTLSNALSGSLRQPRSKIEECLRTAGLNTMVRAQNLSLNDWYGLYVAAVDRKIVGDAK